MFAFAILASSKIIHTPDIYRPGPLFPRPGPCFPRPSPTFPRPVLMNAEQEEDPENIAPVVAWIAEQAAYAAAWEIGKWIGGKLRHQDAESNYIDPRFLLNADEEVDPENVWPIVVAIAKEVAISAATEAAIAAGKWGWHKVFGQEAESNAFLPHIPIRIPDPRIPYPRPILKVNAEEEEDESNPIWGTIAKEVIKEAAKTAAAEAMIAAGKAAWHKVFGQEAESNRIPTRIPDCFPHRWPRYPFPRPIIRANAEEEEDESNPWGPVIKEIIKDAAKSAAAQAIVEGGKAAWHKIFGQEAESNSWLPRYPHYPHYPIWKTY